MTTRRFKVVLEWDADEAVWVTTVPALNGISTYGDTRDDALAQTRELILGYIEALALEGLPAPGEDDNVELVEVEVVSA